MTGPNSNLGQLGTVTGIDKSTGTCSATLRSGLVLFGVPYTGFAPWRGVEARFMEVSSGSWICLGSNGELGGFGPNLVANPSFEVDTSGWDSPFGATGYFFEVNTEGWAGTTATVARDPNVVFQGTASLKVTATGAATINAFAPTGASGITVVPNTSYQAYCYVLNDPNKNSRVVSVRIDWYTAAGAFVSSSAFGTSLSTDGATWRNPNCTATAPGTAGRATIVVQFAAAANGDIFYIDNVALSGGSNTTISRDTATFYSGVASMRLRSTAAGPCYAQTPTPGTDIGSGYPVAEGEVYHVECRYRQANGLPLYVVATWVDAAGNNLGIDFGQDTISVAGTSAFQYFTCQFRVPTNAVGLHMAFNFIASAGAQDLFLDDVGIRQAFVWEGAAISSRRPSGFVSQVGGKQQTPLVITVHPSELDFPKAVINGYMYPRALHARIRRDDNVGQVIATGTWTGLIMSTVAEQAGLTASAGGTIATSYIQVTRNAYYHIEAQVVWDLFAFGGAGIIGLQIARFDSTGVTLLESLGIQTVPVPGTCPAFAQNCAMTARVNRDEKLFVYVLQNTGGNINAKNTGFTLFQHMLSVTYAGDAS